MPGGLERMGIGAILEFDHEVAVAHMDRAGKALGGLKQGLGDVGRGVSQAASGLTQMATSFVPVVLGAGAAVAGAVQRFASFETSLAKIGSLLDGGSKEAATFSSEIERMAIQFGRSAKEMAEGQFQAVSSGVKAAESVAFMEEATRGAVAGFTKTDLAVDALTTVINAYGDQLGASATAAEKAAHINDVLFLANKYGKTTFEEMGASLGNVVNTAASARVPIEELGGAISVLTAAGISTPEAVTAINAALVQFISPSQEMLKAANGMDKVLSLASIKSHGLAGALGLVQEKLGGSTDAMTAFFGGNVRALKAVNVLTGAAMPEFNRQVEEMRTQGGITGRVYNDVSKTMEFNFGRALQVADAGARRVGEAFVEVFGLKGADLATVLASKLDHLEQVARRVFGAIKDSLERLHVREHLEQGIALVQGLAGSLEAGLGSAQARRITDLAVAFGLVATALAPIGLVAMPFIGILTGLASVVLGAVAALGGFGAVAAGASGALASLATFAGPLGALLAVLGALFLGVANNTFGAGEAFRGILGVVGELWTALQAMVTTLVTSLQPAFFGIVGALSGVFSFVAPIAQALAAVLIPAFRLAGSVVGVLASVLGTVLGPPLALVGKLFGALGGALREYVLPVFNAIGEAITWLATKLERFVETLTSAVNTSYKLLGIETDMPLVGEAAQDKRATRRFVDDAISNVGEGVRVAGNALPSLDSLGNLASEAKGAIMDKLGGIMEGVGKKQEISIHNKLCVDGGAMNVATGKARLELMDRAGAGVTPWQRRQIIERGAVTMSGRPG